MGQDGTEVVHITNKAMLGMNLKLMFVTSLLEHTPHTITHKTTHTRWKSFVVAPYRQTHCFLRMCSRSDKVT